MSNEQKASPTDARSEQLEQERLRHKLRVLVMAASALSFHQARPSAPAASPRVDRDVE